MLRRSNLILRSVETIEVRQWKDLSRCVLLKAGFDSCGSCELQKRKAGGRNTL
jgi:hypothetical protein